MCAPIQIKAGIPFCGHMTVEAFEEAGTEHLMKITGQASIDDVQADSMAHVWNSMSFEICGKSLDGSAAIGDENNPVQDDVKVSAILKVAFGLFAKQWFYLCYAYCFLNVFSSEIRPLR